MPTGTIRLHPGVRAPPQCVCRAFPSADAMAKWLPPHGFTCQVHRRGLQPSAGVTPCLACASKAG